MEIIKMSKADYEKKYGTKVPQVSPNQAQEKTSTNTLIDNPITRFVQRRSDDLVNTLTQPKDNTTEQYGVLLRKNREGTLTTEENQQFQKMQSGMQQEATGAALSFGPANLEEGIQNTASKIKPLAQNIEKRAESLVGEVLRPTTKVNKQLTQKIAPQFTEEAPFAFSRKGLLSKAEQKSEEYGRQIGEKFDALPPESKDKLSPILERISKAQDNLTLKGTTTIPKVNQAEHQALSEFKQELVDIAHSTQEIDTPILRSYLQNLDAVINKSGKGFGYNASDKATLTAQKTTANIIRDEMAKSRPDIAKINQAYTFWKRVQKIVGDTIERQTGQIGGVRRTIAGAGGAAAGGAIGQEIGGAPGGVVGTIAGAVITGNLQGIMDSPAFKLINIAARKKAADLILSGRPDIALQILERYLPKAYGASLQLRSQNNQNNTR